RPRRVGPAPRGRGLRLVALRLSPSPRGVALRRRHLPRPLCRSLPPGVHRRAPRDPRRRARSPGRTRLRGPARLALLGRRRAAHRGLRAPSLPGRPAMISSPYDGHPRRLLRQGIALCAAFDAFTLAIVLRDTRPGPDTHPSAPRWLLAPGGDGVILAAAT